MKYHFDFTVYPGVDFKKDSKASDTKYEDNRIEIVQDLVDGLQEFSVKLAAAFARIRIEKKATGETLQEQMINILPAHVREKELLATEIPKTFRINCSSLDTIEAGLVKKGITLYREHNVRSIE
jgi:hypothetical protein